MPLGCQRDQFDLPDGVTYLNCAYMGPLSRPVLEAGRLGLERKARPWTIGPDDFFDPVDEARELFARVIGADADGVALIPAASYGIAVAAANLTLQAGGRIVVLGEEFPSNYYAWRDLASRCGGEVTGVARPADLDWTRALLDAIDDRTSIVAAPVCHWTDGGFVDLVRVGKRVREIGAALVIDATQSAGAMPLDLAAVTPDFFVTASYKWLLGPYSSGFMWVAPQHREGRPLEFSWMTRQHSADFPQLVKYTDDYRSGARRYDVGETSNFALVPAITAALKQTLEWGVDNIYEYAGQLTDKLVAAVRELGLSVTPQGLRARHLIGVHLAGMPIDSITAALEAAGVFVSMRGDAMRVSPHVYNDVSDIDRLVDALSSTLGT